MQGVHVLFRKVKKHVQKKKKINFIVTHHVFICVKPLVEASDPSDSTKIMSMTGDRTWERSGCTNRQSWGRACGLFSLRSPRNHSLPAEASRSHITPWANKASPDLVSITCLKSPPSIPPHSLCSQDTSLLVAPPTFLSTVLPQGLCKCCSLCPRYLGNSSSICSSNNTSADRPSLTIDSNSILYPLLCLDCGVSTHPLQT